MATKTKSPSFTITLTVGNDVYKGSGDSVLEALQALKKPDKIMNKGVLTVSQGKLKKVMPLAPVKIKQLFHSSPSTQAVRAKWLGAGLK